MWRGLYLLGGVLSLGLAVAGAILPLLPTTPFLLLSSYCFARSSPSMQRWLLTHPWFGPYLRDWETHRGVRRSVKILAVVTVLGVVTAAWVWGQQSLPLRVAVTTLASIGLFVVWRLPVVPASVTLKIEPATSADIAA